MIQLGNYRFEDAEVTDLPKEGDNEKIGEVNSFKANAIGEDGNSIPVVVSYRAVLKVGVESEADIDRRISDLEETIAKLNKEKEDKLDDKDKLK